MKHKPVFTVRAEKVPEGARIVTGHTVPKPEFFKTVNALMKALQSYVLETKHQLRAMDNPKDRYVGFVAVGPDGKYGRYFTIRLFDLQEDLHQRPISDAYWAAFKDSASRGILALALSSGHQNGKAS